MFSRISSSPCVAVLSFMMAFPASDVVGQDRTMFGMVRPNISQSSDRHDRSIVVVDCTAQKTSANEAIGMLDGDYAVEHTRLMQRLQNLKKESKTYASDRDSLLESEAKIKQEYRKSRKELVEYFKKTGCGPL